jgi:hypothetical protein
MLKLLAGFTPMILLVGCVGMLLGDAGNKSVFRISGISAAERTEVQRIVASVAADSGYVAAHRPAWVPRLIAFYAAPASDRYRSYIGIQQERGSAVVVAEGDFGPAIPRLDRAQKRLEAALGARFAPRLARGEWSYSFIYRPVSSHANASNQAMQLTAPRSVSPLCVATTFNLRPRALWGAVADLVSR